LAAAALRGELEIHGRGGEYYHAKFITRTERNTGTIEREKKVKPSKEEWRELYQVLARDDPYYKEEN